VAAGPEKQLDTRQQKHLRFCAMNSAPAELAWIEIQKLEAQVPEIADFPIQGIKFKDISPLLAQPGALTSAVGTLYDQLSPLLLDLVLAVDARGFVIGAPLACRIGAGLVMVRKPGKLPGKTHRFSYECEYCTGSLEVTHGIIPSGARCLIVDDLLATGGTARATADFVKSVGATVAGFCFLVELLDLNGRTRLSDADVFSLVKY
jgi:adenine phosphoribosyltransferase